MLRASRRLGLRLGTAFLFSQGEWGFPLCSGMRSFIVLFGRWSTFDTDDNSSLVPAYDAGRLLVGYMTVEEPCSKSPYDLFWDLAMEARRASSKMTHPTLHHISNKTCSSGSLAQQCQRWIVRQPDPDADRRWGSRENAMREQVVTTDEREMAQQE